MVDWPWTVSAEAGVWCQDLTTNQTLAVSFMHPVSTSEK